VQARLQSFQTLQDPLAPIVPPYHRLPQLNFGTHYNDLGGVLDGGLTAEYVRFTHPTLLEGARSSLSPVLAAPLLAPGWFFTPKAGVRYVSYALEPSAGEARSPQVTIPWASLDSGLVFERDSGLFGAGST
jgi:LPS-assembly protein